MKSASLLLILFYSSSSFAVFNQIWQGYLKSNLNQISLSDQDIAKAQFALNENLYSWNLALKLKHEDSNLASLFSFQADRNITETTALTLSRKFYQYGTLSIEHGRNIIDLSKRSSTAFLALSSDTLYESYNQLTYGYEFLDRSSSRDLDIARSEYQRSINALTIKQQKEFLDFFQGYIQAKVKYYEKELKNEFKQRAKKRVGLLKRRVSDGLSKKIDLLQARDQFFEQSQSFEMSQKDLQESLLILEGAIKRRISSEDFKLINWKKNNVYNFPGQRPSKMSRVKELKAYLEKTDFELLKLDDTYGSKLALSASYKMNAFSAVESEAVNDSLNKYENDAKVLMLTFTYPLGGDRSSAITSRARLQKKKVRLELSQFLDELALKRRNIEKALLHISNAHKISTQKIKNAKEMVRRRNKLYLRGQSVLEEVIRSEERLLSAQLLERSLLGQYDIALATKAFWNDGVYRFLNRYRD